jgi:hypothetical protein
MEAKRLGGFPLIKCTYPDISAQEMELRSADEEADLDEPQAPEKESMTGWNTESIWLK